MTKNEFKVYLENLKAKFEADNIILRKTKNKEKIGISYNDGCINIIDLVLTKLKEMK